MPLFSKRRSHAQGSANSTFIAPRWNSRVWTLLGLLCLTAVVGAQVPASAQAGSEVNKEEAYSIDNPAPQRPVLESLKASAKAQGVTLWDAIEGYAQEAAGRMEDSCDRSGDSNSVPQTTLSSESKLETSLGLDLGASELWATDPTAADSSSAELEQYCDLLETYPHPVEIDGIDIDELIDLNRISETKRITLEQAIDRYGTQMDFVDAVAELRSAYPDDYAGAAIVSGGSSAWIAFKGKIPSDAFSLAETISVPIRLIGNRGFSESELKQTIDEASLQLFGRKDVSEGFGSYDQETGIVTLEVRLADAVSSTEAATWVSRLSLPVPANPRITIGVKVVPDLGTHQAGTIRRDCKNYVSDNVCTPWPEYVEDDNMRGGGLFQDRQTCTAGFTVTGPNGFTGNSSAGHCADSPSATTAEYRNQATEDFSSTEVDVQGFHEGSNGDLAYYTDGSMTALPTFYYDTGKTRAVNSVANPVVGANVCKFGRTTGFTCDEIQSLNNTVTYDDGGVTGSQVQTNEGNAKVGDSGGPWFYGNAAFGLTCCSRGTGFFGLSVRDLFTPASKLNTQFSVEVFKQ